MNCAAGTMKSFLLATLIGAASVTGMVQPATACAFDAALPERTEIDWVILSDHLVLSREDPDTPYAFKVTETLVDGGREPRLAEFLDAYTQRSLLANPEDAVLFGFDPLSQKWRRIAYLSPAYRAVVEQVIAKKSGWDPSFDPERFEIFSALQASPESALRDLALRELDKAPYDALRRIEVQIPVEDLLKQMQVPQAYAYIPIRALLLGLSGDEAARTKLRGYVETVAGWDRGTDHLGAFAAGLVEIDGAEGIARLEELILADTSQPLDKLEHIVQALAVHNGVASPDMRQEIAGALARLVAVRPEAAALIARRFGALEDWSQASRLSQLLQDRALRNAADLLQVAVYVAQAKEVEIPTADAVKGG